MQKITLSVKGQSQRVIYYMTALSFTKHIVKITAYLWTPHPHIQIKGMNVCFCLLPGNTLK